MPSREEIAEQTAKELGVFDPRKFACPRGTELIVWDALIDSRCRESELEHKVAIAHDAIPHLTGKVAEIGSRLIDAEASLANLGPNEFITWEQVAARLEAERQRLREALQHAVLCMDRNCKRCVALFKEMNENALASPDVRIETK